MEEANSTGFSPLSYLISLYSAVCGYFCRLFLRIIAVGPIPKHIAIIMDGNRRYADRSRMDRTRGHLYGYDRLISTLENCLQLGVKYVTVYAFSIDNFRRPADEVNALMNLMEEKLDHLCNSNRLTKEFGVRVQVLGDLSLLPSSVRSAAERAMVATRKNRSVVLNLCVAYTSTAEIVHSIQEIRDRFLGTLTHTFPSSTEESSNFYSSAESEVGSCNDIIKRKLEDTNAVHNGYHYGSEVDAVCSKKSAEYLAVSNIYSAVSSHGGSRSQKNGFVRDMSVEPNLAILERGGKSGQEPRNGLIIEHPWANEQLLVCELTEESENAGNQKVPPYSLDFITVKEIENNLYTAGCPPPELLIRTSGETRLSNFLLWQCSSSHLAFCNVLWPEFSLRHLAWIILDYQRSVADLEKQRKLEEDLLSHSVS